MEFTFIGTGTAAPGSERRPSAIHFAMRGLSGMLDIGAGAIHTLAGLGIDPMDVENVFLSHFHSDHVADLIMLLHSNNATPGKTREKELDVFGPKGIRFLADSLMNLFPETVPESYTLNIRELAPGTGMAWESGTAVQTCLTGHTEYSIGYRFSGPEGCFVYTGDAAFSDELVEFCSGADVLITECSYTDDCRTEDHLCVKETAELAARAGVGRLVVVHRYPHTAETRILDEVKEIYSGEILIPSDQETLRF